VLGPHKRGKGWEITAFVPGADGCGCLRARKAEAVPYPGCAGPVLVHRMPRKADYRLRAKAWQRMGIRRSLPLWPRAGRAGRIPLGEGTHKRLWQVLGAHLITHEGVAGVHFAVWAPNAERVSVVGDFNIWDGRRHPMRRRGPTGVWEIFVPGLAEGATYKYEIRGRAARCCRSRPIRWASGLNIRPQMPRS
jgi:1,4-alpha-glucan branching enzyme